MMVVPHRLWFWGNPRRWWFVAAMLAYFITSKSQPLRPEILAQLPSAGLRPLVAADSVGAGVGEEVFFVRGKEAGFPFYPAEPAVDAGIVGIIDYWDIE